MVYYLILILIIVGLGVWVAKLMQEKKENAKEVVLIEKEKEEYVELGRGLTEYNQKLQEKKQQVKIKILDMFGKKPGGKISNKEVSLELKISLATARRYLDVLEAENKIKQVGKTGKNVIYTLI